MNKDIEQEVEWRMKNAYHSRFTWLPEFPGMGFGMNIVKWGDETFNDYTNRHGKSLPRQSILFNNWTKSHPEKIHIGSDRSYGQPGECVISQARGVGDDNVILYTDHKIFPAPSINLFSDHTYEDFIKKEPILVWRGNSTGGCTSFQKTTDIAKYKINRKNFCEVFDGNQNISAKIATMKRNFMSPQDQHKYKYILSLEGNDSSSNPRWIFSANSVSFMPAKHTSELTWHYHIRPWEHYVPFEHDLSDVEQKIEWCETHPKECYEIIKRANEVFKLVTDYSREQQILQLMFEKINQNLICDGSR